MDIENQINSIGPIRGSIPILILKLVLTLTLFDVFYNSAFYFLNIQFATPYEFHHHLSLGFFALHIVTIFLQLYFIVYLILQWVNNAYYLYPKQIVKIKGVLNMRRDISNFESILLWKTGRYNINRCIYS